MSGYEGLWGYLVLVLVGFLPADVCQILLWASLVHEEPHITIDTVGKLIQERKYINDKVIECLEACWPTKKADDEEDAPQDQEKKTKVQPNGAIWKPSPESNLE